MWCEIERVKTPDGQTQAVIESQMQARAPDEEEIGEISTHPHAQMRRMGARSVLQAPFSQIRIVAKSDACRATLGRWTGVGTPVTEWEQRLARWAISNGLAVRAYKGLAMDSDEECAQSRWSTEEGAFWAEMGGQKENNQVRGASWRGITKGKPIRIKREDANGSDDQGAIALEQAHGAPRAIAESAWEFGKEGVATRALGWWLWRFAAVRSRTVAEVHGVCVETAKRGAPEGGGMVTIGLTLALRSARERPEGVWGYDAVSHGLKWVGDDTAAFFTHARDALDPNVGNPTGVAIIYVDIERMNAKYENMALSVSLLNAGVCIAAAYEAGRHEQISVRALGSAPAQEWLAATKRDPSRQCPIGAFVFGMRV